MAEKNPARDLVLRFQDLGQRSAQEMTPALRAEWTALRAEAKAAAGGLHAELPYVDGGLAISAVVAGLWKAIILPAAAAPVRDGSLRPGDQRGCAAAVESACATLLIWKA